MSSVTGQAQGNEPWVSATSRPQNAATTPGWLSAGRPRREAFRVGVRLTARWRVRELHDALVDQAAALTRHARSTATALATDYTYLQPAQPTTVGHLLLAYAYPALRDAARARANYAALGASVAGAGGSAV